MAVVFKWTGSNTTIDNVKECVTSEESTPLSFDCFDYVELATVDLQKAVARAIRVECTKSHEWRSVRLVAQTSDGMHELTINPVFGYRPAYDSLYPLQKHRDTACNAWNCFINALTAAKKNQRKVLVLVSRYSQVDCALSRIVLWKPSDLVKNMKKLPLQVQQHKRLIAKALSINGAWLQFCPESTKQDLEQVLVAVRTCTDAFKFAAQELRESKEAVLAAVEVRGDTYMHAAPILQRDRDVVLAACCKSSKAAEFIFNSSDVHLRCFATDRAVALAAIKALTCDLGVFEHFQNDKDFVLAVVAFYGPSLSDASALLQDADDVVAAAIQQDYHALYYASPRLKACLKTAMLAVTESPNAVNYVADALHSNRELIELVATTGGTQALQFVRSPLKYDPQLLEMALERNAKMRR